MANSLFKPNATGEAKKRYRLIKNSEVIKVGDFVVDEATGMANVDGVTELIYGLATAIVTAKKVSLESASADANDFDGTWVAATKSYTAAADNETDKKVMVEYIPVREGDQFLVTLSAAKGGTTGSNLAGYYLSINTSDSSQLLETSASTSSTNTQFRIVDPYLQGSTTQVVVETIVRGTE